MRFQLATFLVLLSVLSGCGYNSLQGLDEDVKAAAAEVDNQYTRRSDLIPNLVSTVKGYAAHEKDTLTAVVEARAKATQTKLDASTLSDPQKMQAYQAAQGSMGQALSRLMVVVEKYPDLKANQNFRDLRAQLEGTENRIAVARRRFILSISEFNKSVRSFPTNLTAKYLLSMTIRENFTADESKKANPEVTF
jgi:LemA protein